MKIINESTCCPRRNKIIEATSKIRTKGFRKFPRKSTKGCVCCSSTKTFRPNSRDLRSASSLVRPERVESRALIISSPVCVAAKIRELLESILICNQLFPSVLSRTTNKRHKIPIHKVARHKIKELGRHGVIILIG